MIALKHILVATDFSEPSDVALTYGRELAGRFDARLHVLHVVQNIYSASFAFESAAVMSADLLVQLEAQARDRLQVILADNDKTGPTPIPVVCRGASVAREIVEYARAHDVSLIVMGTHGRGAMAHLVVGSVAERVVRLAPCPVLTVRHPERDFVRPDTPAVVAHA
jgi:nucleotide-binding universal stress UspA family protein